MKTLLTQASATSSFAAHSSAPSSIMSMLGFSRQKGRVQRGRPIYAMADSSSGDFSVSGDAPETKDNYQDDEFQKSGPVKTGNSTNN